MAMEMHVPEAYALEDFYFDGIANLYVIGGMFHVTFWAWTKTEDGLFKMGIRRAVCPAENVNACAFESIATVTQAGFKNAVPPMTSKIFTDVKHQ